MAILTINQHYVPKFLIKRFADTNGLVHAFVRDEQRYVRRSPKKIFVAEHLYTRQQQFGLFDDDAEKHFGRIESDAAPVVGKIVEETRRGLIPTLSASEKAAWDRLFLAQFVRVPGFDQRFDMRSAFAEQYELVTQKMAAANALTVTDRKLLASDEVRAQIAQNAKVFALMAPKSQTEGLMAASGLAIGAVTDKTKCLFLSDFPVVKLDGTPPNDLSTWVSDLWLPVAPDIAVCPAFRSGEIKRRSFAPAYVARLNEANYNTCQTIAGPSLELLQTFVSHQERLTSKGASVLA